MGGGLDPNVSPGIGGFLAFFLLACALWLLMRNMLKHMRSVEYHEERAEREEQARLQARAGVGDSSAPEATGVSADGGLDGVISSEDDEVVTRPSSLSAGYPRKHKA